MLLLVLFVSRCRCGTRLAVFVCGGLLAVAVLAGVVQYYESRSRYDLVVFGNTNRVEIARRRHV